MKSIWSETAQLPNYPSQTQDMRTDILIIGGGMTGLLCGHFLKEKNADYIIIDQHNIAGHTTANTTAKITTQHGLIYSNLLRYQGEEIAQGYLQANQQAMETLIALAETIACDLERKTNLIYDMSSRQSILDERKALEAIGGKGVYIERPDNLPITPKAAMATLNQAQFHPLKFLEAIAKPQQQHIYEETKALDIKKEGTGYVVTTQNPYTCTDQYRSIYAKTVIIATHFPFKNIRGLYFMKMHQSRSYAVLLDNVDQGKLPEFMAMGSQSHDLSFRTYQDKLILGGRGGKTGKHHGGFAQLALDAEKLYPGSTITKVWATQDCMTLDQIPYIGNHNPSHPGVKVATGFNKWGMTNAMVSALILTDQMDKEIANIFYPHRSMAHPKVLVNAVNATVNLLKPRGPRCSHLGCTLQWNSAEQSWDCPCHGSRYDKKGEVINEPAQRNIKKS